MSIGVPIEKEYWGTMISGLFMPDIIVIGGGAAGVFGAAVAAQANSASSVVLMERSGHLLAKVRVSGGGRCNVTHACFEPKKLVGYYPRGSRELLGPFHNFQPKDTIEWFERRGVSLKVENDGRMFPTTDSSATIVDCLLQDAQKNGVSFRLKQPIKAIRKEKDHFELDLDGESSVTCSRLLLATGSNAQGHAFARSLGHTIVEPVPSLFTFNVPSSPLLDLSGASVPDASLRLEGQKTSQRGPLLLTHWGFSGPAALRLSAWEARALHACGYCTKLIINWLGNEKREDCLAVLLRLKSACPFSTLLSKNPFGLPRKLWKRHLELAGFGLDRRISEVSNKELTRLAERLVADVYQVEGKTTYKEEFVTCGGVALEEINFKTMESKVCPGLFFTGEILDIDGVTGGFNFQNAWTTAWIAGHAMAGKQ